MRSFAHLDGKTFEILVAPERGRLKAQVAGETIEVALDDRREPIRQATVGGRIVEFGWVRAEGAYRIQIDGFEYEVVLRDPKSESLAKAAASAGPSAQAETRAPIPGLVKRVLVQEGETVKRDQAILHLDAMKLENEIASPRDGTMRSIAVREGQAVEKGQLLFVVA